MVGTFYGGGGTKVHYVGYYTSQTQGVGTTIMSTTTMVEVSHECEIVTYKVAGLTHAKYMVVVTKLVNTT